METTAEQIKKLEQELATLKEKERIEKEEARKKEKAEIETDLQHIKDTINAFNKKYNDIGKDLFDTLFPWWDD